MTIVGLGSALAVAGACTAWDTAIAPAKDSGVAPESSTPGADGSRPSDASVPLPAPGLLALDDATRLCSRLATCEKLNSVITNALLLPVDVPNYSECVSELASTYEPGRAGRDIAKYVLERMARAGSCDDAAKEIWLQFGPSLDPACTVDAGDAGDGGNVGPAPATLCGDASTVVFCDRVQGMSAYERCDSPANPGTTCTTLEAGALCAAKSTCAGSRCAGSGSVLELCLADDGGTTAAAHTGRVDCAVLGLTCLVEEGRNNVGCADDEGVIRRNPYLGSGAYCERTKRIVTGAAFGKALDCAKFDASCIDCLAADAACGPTTQGAQCGRTNDECTAFSPGIDQCAGDTIALCVGGKRQSFDCTSIGRRCVDAFDAARVTWRGACR